MNHRTASFNFQQLFKVQLIALTVSWAAYYSQCVPMAFSRLYMFLSDSNSFFRNQEQYAQCPERTDLFSIEQIYFFAVLSIMQKRNCRERENEHKQLYWFTQPELHPVFTNNRWNSLTHSTIKYTSHCSWNLQELRYSCWKNLFQHSYTHIHSPRTPIKKSVQPNYYKE